MEQEFEPEADDSLISAITDDHRLRMISDPIYRLQHEKEDQIKTLSSKERLTALQDIQSEYYKEDSISNSELRKSHRLRRARDNELLSEGRKRQMSIPLVEPHPDDETTARLARSKFKKNESFSASLKMRRIRLHAQSVKCIPFSHARRNSGDNPSSALEKRMHLCVNPSNLVMKSDPRLSVLHDATIVAKNKREVLPSSLELLSTYDG